VQERLSLLPDGRIVYRLARPWPTPTGRTERVLDPVDFLRRLAARIPAPDNHCGPPRLPRDDDRVLDLDEDPPDQGDGEVEPAVRRRTALRLDNGQCGVPTGSTRTKCGGRTDHGAASSGTNALRGIDRIASWCQEAEHTHEEPASNKRPGSR